MNQNSNECMKLCQVFDTVRVDEMAQDKIIVRGAKEHNLKNVNVEIPRNKLVVITGLSGSGKARLRLTQSMPRDREDMLKAFLPMQECFSVRWTSLMLKA